VQVRHNREEHRFEVDLGDTTALATYRRRGHTIIFPHTEVPKQHEGRGIGTMLVKAGLDYAREEGLKVVPVCPFFASYMKRHPEVHDLLDDRTSSLKP